MRTLYLLRHAKASSVEAGGRDFDRTLDMQGRQAATKVGSVLASEKVVNLFFLSSPAVRARETTEIIVESLAVEADVRFDSLIYEADLRSLLSSLSKIKDDTEVVVLVGHNPGLEILLRFLTGETRAMPTAGVAKLVLRSKSWSDLNQAEGKFIWLAS
jgi:phosphohistidine phosphatase